MNEARIAKGSESENLLAKVDWMLKEVHSIE